MRKSLSHAALAALLCGSLIPCFAHAGSAEWEGTWVGAWNGTRSTTLEIAGGRVTGYEHLGQSCQVTSAYVSDETLTMVVQPNDVRVRLARTATGSLIGRYEDDMGTIGLIHMVPDAKASSRSSCMMERTNLVADH